jgi:hypothetical protein
MDQPPTVTFGVSLLFIGKLDSDHYDAPLPVEDKDSSVTFDEVCFKRQ